MRIARSLLDQMIEHARAEATRLSEQIESDSAQIGSGQLQAGVLKLAAAA